MKIAIPTNDRISVAERTGQAAEFAVFTILNKTVTETEYRVNDHKHEHHSHGHTEHHDHSHDEVVTLLKDTDLLLIHRVGPHMLESLQNGGITYEVINEQQISDVLQRFLA